MEGPQDYEDDGFIIQDDALLEVDSDEYDTVIEDKLAAFHEQQADEYAQLQASSHWVVLPLPSPGPVKQQMRAEERQQLTELPDESAGQHGRTEYVPPPRSMALQQHLDGPFPAADCPAAVLQRPVTAPPGHRFHAGSNQDHDQLQGSTSGLASNVDSRIEPDTGPAAHQGQEPSFQMDHVSADQPAEAEADVECQRSSGGAENAAAVYEGTNLCTAEDPSLQVGSVSPSDHGDYLPAAADSGLWPCERADCTVGQGDSTDMAAPHQQGAAVLYPPGQHADSAPAITAHMWEPPATLQAELCEAEPTEAQKADDCRTAAASAAAVTAQVGRPARSSVQSTEGFFLDHLDSDHGAQCGVVADQSGVMYLHQTLQDSTRADSNRHKPAEATALQAADIAAAAHVAAVTADRSEAGEALTREEMQVSAEDTMGPDVAVASKAVVAEVATGYASAGGTLADETAAGIREGIQLVADEALAVDAAIATAPAAEGVHKPPPVTSQTGIDAAGSDTEPGSDAEACPNSTASGLVVDHAEGVASHGAHVPAAPDDVASTTHLHVLQLEQQQQGVHQNAGKQQVNLPSEQQQLEQKECDVVGEGTEQQVVCQQHQGQEQVVAAFTSQPLQPGEVQLQQRAWGSSGGSASDRQVLAGQRDHTEDHTGDHSQSQLQMQEQQIPQVQYGAAADLEQHGPPGQEPVEATGLAAVLATGLATETRAEVIERQQEAMLQRSSRTLEHQVQCHIADRHSACDDDIKHSAVAAAAVDLEQEEQGCICAYHDVRSEQPELQEQEQLSDVGVDSAVEPVHEADPSGGLQETASRGYPATAAGSTSAQLVQQRLTAEAAEADDGFIYLDEDAEDSSSCSSPVTPAAEPVVAAEAGLGVRGLTGSAAQPGLLLCEGSPEAAQTCWFPDIGRGDNLFERHSLTGWPDGGCGYDAASSPPSAVTTAQVEPAQSPVYKLHHSNRPMHSKTRPAASPVFMARLSGSSDLAATAGPAGYMAGPRLRPESAPARRVLSPTSRQRYVPQGLDRGFGRPVWMPGGADAAAAEQQLGEVYAQQTTPWGCSSIPSGMQLPTRPHTSHGLGMICGSGRDAAVSPSRRPAWVQPTGVALRPGDAAWSGGEGGGSSCNKAVWRSASAERDTRAAAGAHVQLSQQPRQSAGRIRPGSAELYGRKLTWQDGTAKRASSSKPYGGWQHQQVLHGSSMAHLQGHSEAVYLQQAYGYEPRCSVAADDLCSSHWQQQHQQQRRVKAQPGDIPWDDSPIPLNTPSRMPIAVATQSYEALQAAKASHLGAGPSALSPAAAAHSATLTRPRTAGSVDTGALCREGPSITPRMVQHRAAVAQLGVCNNGSTASSSVYLVDVLQRIRQANNICRRLGMGKQYRLGKGSPVTWQQQQILVELWVLMRGHHATHDHAQAEHVQSEQLKQEQQSWQLKYCLTLEQFNKQYDRLAAETSTACAQQDVESCSASRPCSSDRTRYGSQAAAAGCSQVSRQAWMSARGPGSGGVYHEAEQHRLMRPQSAYSAGDASAARHQGQGRAMGAGAGPAAMFSAAPSYLQHSAAVADGQQVYATLSGLNGSFLPYAVPAWMEEYL